MINHDPLRRHNLNKDVMIRIIHTVRSVHSVLPRTSLPHIALVKRIREVLRSPPVCQYIRGCPGSKHKLTRNIVLARSHKFIFTHCHVLTSPSTTLPSVFNMMFVPCSRVSGVSCPSKNAPCSVKINFVPPS